MNVTVKWMRMLPYGGHCHGVAEIDDQDKTYSATVILENTICHTLVRHLSLGNSMTVKVK